MPGTLIIVWYAHNYERRILTSMPSIQLKISDLTKVTGYTRFQMRGMLDEVFPVSAHVKDGGSQRTFSPQELLLVAVACEIEKKYGVRRSVLALASESLRKALTGPRASNREARLVVTFEPPTATYLVSDAPVREGLVLELGHLFALVDEYLGVAGPGGGSAQALLPLSPMMVTHRRGSSSRSR